MFSIDYSFGFLGWLIIGIFVAVAGFAVFYLGFAVRGAQKIVDDADHAHDGEVVQPKVDTTP